MEKPKDDLLKKAGEQEDDQLPAEDAGDDAGSIEKYIEHKKLQNRILKEMLEKNNIKIKKKQQPKTKNNQHP